MEVEIQDLCDWTDGRKIPTKHGPRILRTAPPSKAFSSLWKAAKPTLKAAGLTFRKLDSGSWQVQWWQPDTQAEEAVNRRYEESFEHRTNETLPCAEPYKPYGYQVLGAKFALERERILLGDDMGLGKSLQTILVCNTDERIKEAVIVCPSTIKINWKREFQKFGTRKNTRIVLCEGQSKTAAKQAALMAQAKHDGLRVWVINYDILPYWKEFMHSRKWDLVACDEAQNIKNARSKRTQVIRGTYDKSKRAWVDATDARVKMILTGTPIENNTTELKVMLQWLGVMQNFPRYDERYGALMNQRSRDELNRLLREHVMMRRLKEDVLTDLPGKVRSVVEFEGDAEARAGLEAIEKEIREKVEVKLADMKKGEQSQEDIDAALGKLQQGDFPGVPFELIARVRKETGRAKVKGAATHITQLHESISGEPIIVFCHHIEEVLTPLKGALEQAGLKVGVITGQQNATQKQAVVDSFQAGELDICLCNIRAAGVGLTLTKAAHVVFVEFDWVPSKMLQAEDRANRIGQTKVVVVHILAMRDSLDCRMAQLVAQKADLARSVLDKRLERKEPADDKAKAVEVAKRDALKADAPGQNAGLATLTLDSAQEATLEQENAKHEEADKVTPEQRQDLQERLQSVACACDGARADDGAGFNKLDTGLGTNLAYGLADMWTPGQTEQALRLVRKYRRQAGLPTWMEKS